MLLISSIIAILAIIVILIIRILNVREIEIPIMATSSSTRTISGHNIVGGGSHVSPKHVIDKMRTDPLKPVVQSLIKKSREGNIMNPIVHLSDIPDSLPYQSLKHLRRSLHVGQLKLFLSEIQFLTEYVSPEKSKAAVESQIQSAIQAQSGLSQVQTYVIYAGSGPGHKDKMLSNLFPNVKFILIDPQEHFIMHSPSDDRLYFRLPHKTAFARETIHIATTSGLKSREKGIPLRANEQLDPTQITRTILNEPRFTFYIIEDLFTDELAQAFRAISASGHIVLFISDIRTNARSMINSQSSVKRGGQDSIYEDIAAIVGAAELDQNPDQKSSAKPDQKSADLFGEDEDEEQSPHDLDILVNGIWQHTWVDILQPTACMLKFRTPFMNPADVQTMSQFIRHPMYSSSIAKYKERFKIDVIDEYKKGRYWFMPNDHINIQAFPGPSSTETRLIATVGNYNRLVQYNPKEYEDRLFYYNLMREVCYVPKYESNFGFIPGFDGCLDCCLAIEILTRYTTKYNVQRQPFHLLRDVLQMIGRPIQLGFHGQIYESYADINDLLHNIVSRESAYNVSDIVNPGAAPFTHKK